MEFAWKDHKVVLFISTVHTGALTVVAPRRRPAATSLGARQARLAFGDQRVKKLVISNFIDQYNHYMRGVDIADQLRSYYTTQRIHFKT